MGGDWDGTEQSRDRSLVQGRDLWAAQSSRIGRESYFLNVSIDVATPFIPSRPTTRQGWNDRRRDTLSRRGMLHDRG